MHLDGRNHAAEVKKEAELAVENVEVNSLGGAHYAGIPAR
jgi:hypothetical protein